MSEAYAYRKIGYFEVVTADAKNLIICNNHLRLMLIVKFMGFFSVVKLQKLYLSFRPIGNQFKKNSPAAGQLKLNVKIISL